MLYALPLGAWRLPIFFGYKIQVRPKLRIVGCVSGLTYILVVNGGPLDPERPSNLFYNRIQELRKCGYR